MATYMPKVSDGRLSIKDFQTLLSLGEKLFVVNGNQHKYVFLIGENEVKVIHGTEGVSFYGITVSRDIFDGDLRRVGVRGNPFVMRLGRRVFAPPTPVLASYLRDREEAIQYLGVDWESGEEVPKLLSEAEKTLARIEGLFPGAVDKLLNGCRAVVFIATTDPTHEFENMVRGKAVCSGFIRRRDFP